MDVKPLDQRRITYLNDYRPPIFVVTDIDLRFDLTDKACLVSAKMHVERRDDPTRSSALRLDGEELELVSVTLQGERLSPGRYQVLTDALVIHNVPDAFDITIETRIYPQHNTALMGLYLSAGNYCTQCEAEGFRRIMYMLDRPDVLARYSTTIVADKARFPALLSNGNRVDYGEADSRRHYATWNDPFPKPSYLFALVAGNLAYLEDQFTTCRGRHVVLRIYVESHNVDKCEHAMLSLKRAMRWDEQTYGREYDLDIYMIVAVDDFNMGAMENKGLNVFNSKYVLARPDTATDADYQAIEAIIGHEYFHNWSGNRVTCRDWFQLSLKEGFTVFRDQEFTGDVNSRAVKRIHDVNMLRTQQFREDAGPMAHPVRPSSYMEINNFYTATVYNKGAELIRMMRLLLGSERFRSGTDLYFSRYDGKAVTTDDFVDALEVASGVNLTQFKRWYAQSGTPQLQIEGYHDKAVCRFQLHVRQSCAPTPGQENKLPFHIPLVMALLDSTGNKIPLRFEGEDGPVEMTKLLSISETSQTFSFVDVPHEPTPSYLRGFSAPVKLVTNLSENQLEFLATHDDDPFSRWDANQRVSIAVILRVMEQVQAGIATASGEPLAKVFQEHLAGSSRDPMFASLLLSLPSEHYISEFVECIDPVGIHQACRLVRENLAAQLSEEFRSVFEANSDQRAGSQSDVGAMARRSLKNVCLGYLMELNDAGIRKRCITQVSSSNNMTDTIAALTFIANTTGDERESSLRDFYALWKHDPLVVDKWLAIQASSRLPDTLQRVRVLLKHPAFTLQNPNRVRAVLGTFSHGNPAQFHAISGSGYELVADSVIEIDAMNPQVAARLASAFSAWRRFDTTRQTAMQSQLQRIRSKPKLSRDTYEVVATILGDA